mgnify:CR=1 FL=1|tara:strand:+ start:691 stop:1044 length:354 start_codon:yes stop_codon:yes gene_type:complete
MSRLEVILSAILFLSLIFNVGLFIYARNVVSKLLFVSEELGDLQNMTDSFAKHLKAVYELEMFYGDETLQHLLNHAVSFNEQLMTFEEIYSLTEEQQLDNREQRDEEDSYEEAEAIS